MFGEGGNSGQSRDMELSPNAELHTPGLVPKHRTITEVTAACGSVPSPVTVASRGPWGDTGQTPLAGGSWACVSEKVTTTWPCSRSRHPPPPETPQKRVQGGRPFPEPPIRVRAGAWTAVSAVGTPGAGSVSVHVRRPGPHGPAQGSSAGL